jgi:PIN domain nuclease of toxin-antitoxin system
MQLLLDTHTFLWWIDDAPALSKKARMVIGKAGNECFVSLASCWEMAIKCSLGKLSLTQPVDRFIPEQLAANGFQLLDIDFRHVSRVATMPFHHRDPFDRLLIAQASAEKLTMVSADAAFDAYDISRLW